MTSDREGDFSAQERIDELLRAIEYIEAHESERALPILRALIRHNHNDADAWLWMSVAVDNVDESAVCLDNVLRINPQHARATEALYRLREAEMNSQHQRARLRFIRDLALGGVWVLFFGILLAIVLTYATGNVPA